jgi:hypothetical protein
VNRPAKVGKRSKKFMDFLKLGGMAVSPFRRTFELGEFITAGGKSIIDLVEL